LKVSGGGSTSPSGLVAFPGAYKSADPGITVDAYKGMLSVRLQGMGLTWSSASVYDSWTEEVHLLDGVWGWLRFVVILVYMRMVALSHRCCNV
jgi:hypothetical protein